MVGTADSGVWRGDRTVYITARSWEKVKLIIPLPSLPHVKRGRGVQGNQYPEHSLLLSLDNYKEAFKDDHLTLALTPCSSACGF